MSDDLIRRSDAIKALNREKSDWNCDYNVPIDNCIKRLNKVKSADRPQGWIDKAISIIDDIQREGIIDYEQAWEFRMRARMKGADDEHLSR